MTREEHKCKYAENKSGDVYECNGYSKVDCPFRSCDYNPDGSVNIFICDYIKICGVEKMTEEEKQKLDYMEFDDNGLHFECYKGGLLVTKNGEKVGQCFDVFTKCMPPEEDVIKFWEVLSKMTKE